MAVDTPLLEPEDELGHDIFTDIAQRRWACGLDKPAEERADRQRANFSSKRKPASILRAVFGHF
jgi:hypothetical protein